MYSMSQLVKEIASYTDDLVRLGATLHPDFVTQKILADHQAIEGDDSDFYTCVSKETIRDQVVKRIRKFKVKPESQISPDNQIVMPGFERVQVAYVIDADGEQIAVPLVKMTSAQRRAKVTELRAMGAGCYQHADELERYESLYPAAA
ncbi:MAG: hypothetical protein IPI57_12035 [Candidatus Competibacteraceae bacterium]|nr:hypothetical protein [Candidatus Competibacteraceae bacterium]